MRQTFLFTPSPLLKHIILGVLFSCGTLLIFHTIAPDHSKRSTEFLLLKEKIRIRLESSLIESVDQFVTHERSWKRYTKNAELLITLTHPPQKHDYPTLREQHPEWQKNLVEITSSQGKIRRHHDELMRLRANRDSLDYRTSSLLASTNRVLERLIENRGNSHIIKRCFELRHSLESIRNAAERFWIDSRNRDELYEMITSRHRIAADLSMELLSGKNALEHTALRREILAVNDKLSKLQANLNELESADNILDKMDHLQTNLNTLITEAIENFPKGKNNPSAGISIGMGLLLVAIWIIIFLIKEKKVLKPQKASQELSKIHTDRPAHRESGAIHQSEILHAIKQTEKGNLAFRISERNVTNREIAIAYNQMMAALYRHMINIHKPISTALSTIRAQQPCEAQPTEQLENRSIPSSVSKCSNQLDRVINITYEIAAAVEKIQYKAKKGQQNACELWRTCEKGILDIEHYQSLIRVIIRDQIDNDTGSISSQKEEPAECEKEALHLLETAMQELSFFKLDKRI